MKSGPAATVRAGSPAAVEPLGEAKGMPGWKGARLVIGEALAAGDSGLLLELKDRAVTIRRRVDEAWQSADPLAVEDAVVVFAALRRLAAAVPAGQEEPRFEISGSKVPRRVCHVAARSTAKSEQVLLLLGPELPPHERLTLGRLLAGVFGWLVPFRRRPPPPQRDPSLPRLELAGTGDEAAARTEAATAADGYKVACDVVAAAIRDRARMISFEASPQGVAVRLDIDGVASPMPKLEPALSLDKPRVAAVVGVLKTVAGFDMKDRGAQTSKITAMVEGKPWACTVSGSRSASGERLDVVIDHVRPKFKTLADLGMPEAVAKQLDEFLKLESGLIVLAAPPGGGLSTLFDGVIGAADRLLRDFVILEDAAAPRPEIQNLRPVRWDSRTGGQPGSALDAAMREYANVLTSCDLEDAELCKRLVAQAGEGKLVVVGVRATDAAEAIARLLGWGVDPQTVSRTLLAAVSVRLVRKLCPKCRREFFPAVAPLARLGLDPDLTFTLFRPTQGGCPVCTGTGYLGRTASCELGAGPTLKTYVAKGADAGVLRKAAVKDGMVPMLQDAIAKAARGVTSVEEVQRVFQGR